MIYKMTLKDSTDEMTFNLLEVPIVDKDIEGAVDNVTLDGNQYTDYLYLKKQYIQKWSIMCDEEYERLRGFYTRQFDEAEIPTYELYYGETIYNDYTLSGDYILADVQGVEPARMSLAQLDGNATQTTYSGKNLLPSINTTRTRNGVTFTHNEDGSISLSGTASADTAYPINVNSTGNSRNVPLSAGNYIVSGGSATSPTTVFMQAYYGTTGGADRYSTSTFTLEADGTMGAYIYVKSGANTAGKTIYPMVEQGSTATSYEPYVGGTPAPNPDYPQPISTVTGENVVKVVGKNLLGLEDVAETVSPTGVTYSVVNGVVTINGKASSAGRIEIPLRSKIKLSNGVNYTFSLTESGTLTDGYYEAQLRTAQSTNLLSERNTRLPVTFSNIDGTVAYLGIYTGANRVFANYTVSPQLEQGSTATTYEPYQAQSFTIDLGALELAKIGTYQDRIYKDGEKWYVEKQVGKLNNVDAVDSSADVDVNTRRFYISSAGSAQNASSILATSSHFAGIPYSERNAHAGESWVFANGNLAFQIPKTLANTMTEFRDWWDSNSATVYYALATPTTTEITNQTLIDQLEALTNVSITTGIHNIFTEVASGNLNSTMILNFIEVVSRRVTLVPETPVRLTLTDGGIINACGCRKDVQLTMRETIE